MSDYKVGDLVKVTVTGKVEDVGLAGGVLLAGWDYYIYPQAGITFEKTAPPLPTAPGSVVISHTGVIYTLGTDGLWYTPYGVTVGDGRGREWLTGKSASHDVIYDAGEKS